MKERFPDIKVKMSRRKGLQVIPRNPTGKTRQSELDRKGITFEGDMVLFTLCTWNKIYVLILVTCLTHLLFGSFANQFK